MAYTNNARNPKVDYCPCAFPQQR